MRTLLIIVIASFVLPAFAQTYIPPIGIPTPEFGINESHMMYVNSQYEYGNGLEDYKDAGNGPYTHYVDNSVSCTNTNNSYGTSTNPRCTLPKTPGIYAAGSVVEIHGGPYNYGGFQNIIANGTASNPVFFRGINNANGNRVQYINTNLRVAGEYMVIENLELYSRSGIRINPNWDAQNRSSYISLRNSEVHKPIDEIGNGNGVQAGGNNIVIYDNEIHHQVRSDIADAHGIVVTTGANSVWILENNIHNNGGNGIQACHNCNPAPRYIYIGKNTIHDDRELGIGLKYAEDVVISQNRIWGYNYSDTATPCGIVVGAAGATTRVWMIFNEIFDSRLGIRIEETPTDVWIIGNVIYDISGVGVNLEKNALDVYVLNNTFDNVGEGINQSGRRFFLLKAYNNIFSNVATYPFYLQHIDVSSVSTASNNLVFQNGSSFPIYWRPTNGNYTTTADLSDFSGGINNIVSDPDFLSPAYEIGANSAAINAGSNTGDAIFPYTQFEDLYDGINIRFDFNGVARPLNSDWDIGAFEFNSELILSDGFE